jgi:hypothetical protein
MYEELFRQSIKGTAECKIIYDKFAEAFHFFLCTLTKNFVIKISPVQNWNLTDCKIKDDGAVQENA